MIVAQPAFVGEALPKIALFVEDEFTKAYLEALWSTKTIGIRVAGSNDLVRASVRDGGGQAKRVFGLVDRDFGTSSYTGGNWRVPHNSVFVLHTHEIENCLLDFESLEKCDENTRHNRTSEELERKAKQLADSSVFWHACRRHLRELHSGITSRFPPDPALGAVKWHQDAVAAICDGPWFTSGFLAGAAEVDRAKVDVRLQALESDYRSCLSDGSWVGQMSGKELLRELRGYIFGANHGSSQPDLDLAKSVALWQRRNRMPAPLRELRDLLLQGVP